MPHLVSRSFQGQYFYFRRFPALRRGLRRRAGTFTAADSGAIAGAGSRDIALNTCRNAYRNARWRRWLSGPFIVGAIGSTGVGTGFARGLTI